MREDGFLGVSQLAVLNRLLRPPSGRNGEGKKDSGLVGLRRSFIR